jgi:phosphoadenosine phosphosulfate reductase
MIAQTSFRLSPLEIGSANQYLANKTPQDIIQWSVGMFHPRLTMATAFGAEGCCIIHIIAEIEPSVRIFNLDTGYQFRETLEMRDRIRDRYRIDVEFVTPEFSVSEYEKEHGGPLYSIRPDQCCYDRKIVPLKRAVFGFDAWISAIRGDQTDSRKAAAIVEPDPKFGLIKVNPLLRWTKAEVWKFILANDIPYNPLHDRNYPSIGCQPCTQPVFGDGDERSGRWSGMPKKECGLHVIEHQDGSGI